ncbi:MAG TPA: helix-turn-helix domain-containing protein [Terracidiphilus sp.]|nr:helix-turn-helix domain-containing protein [Terracidiphilus sp.]
MYLYEHGSFSFSRRSPAYRRLCAQIFGDHIRTLRVRDGCPLAELAPKAGLTVEEWQQIEAGQTAYAWECVLLMATALELDRASWLPYFAQLYQGAQEN